MKIVILKRKIFQINIVVVSEGIAEITMDSEEETYDVDSGNESSGDDVDFAMDVEVTEHREKQTDSEDYPYEVLSTEEIVKHMVDSIKEVNSVVEVNNKSTIFITKTMQVISAITSTNLCLCYLFSKQDPCNNHPHFIKPFSMG